MTWLSRGAQQLPQNDMSGSLINRWSAAALFVTALIAFPGTASARKAGIAAAGCDGCHSGGQPATVTITANPVSPTIGQATTLTINVSATNGAVAGFYLTTEDVNKGTFKSIESGTLANSAGVSHTAARTGSGGSTTFKVEWSASVATGVNFAVYALSANGDGNTRGDAGGQAFLGITTGCTASAYYIDQDGDGYGSADPAYPPRMDCAAPQGYAAKTSDCNDFNEKIFPAAPELCDGKDNNCDGKIDESVVNSMYCEDKDGDGHGITGGATKTDCAPSTGYGDCNGDCNDQVKSIYLGAPEICDGRDNNCDGKVDEGVRMTCGVGWCRRYAEGCTAVCTAGPPAAETCNYFDDDCDGVIDNGTDAALCGGAGLVCVLGRCLNEDGSPSSTGGGSGSVSGGGGTNGGGAGGSGSGTGTGASGEPGSGGAGATRGAEGGGCAIGSALTGGRGNRAAIRELLDFFDLLGLLGLGAVFLRWRGRTALPGRRPPR